MASTNKTPNLNLTQFVAEDKPSWLMDYNADMQAIDTAITAGGIHPAAPGKTGNLHSIRFAGEGNLCRFTATSDFEPGDQLELNGAALPLLDCDGAPFTSGAWNTGDLVILATGDTGVRVLAPLHNKMDSCAPETIQLPFATGYGNLNGRNKASYVTKTQDGFVYVNIAATGTFRHSTVFATLPVGFRPREKQNASDLPDLLGLCTIEGGSVTRQPVAIMSNGNGQLSTINTGTGIQDATTLRGFMVFKAEK